MCCHVELVNVQGGPKLYIAFAELSLKSNAAWYIAAFVSRGGLGRLAAWHIPGGPVGPPARWAARSNVAIGHLIDLIRPNSPKEEGYTEGRERRERGTGPQKGGQGRSEPRWK